MTPEMTAVAIAIEQSETAADAALAECERLAASPVINPMTPTSVEDLGRTVLSLHEDVKRIAFGADWFQTHADVAMFLGNRLQAALMHMYRAGAHMRDSNMAVGQMQSCRSFSQWEALFICTYLATSTMRFALEQLHSAFDLVASAYEIAEKEHARNQLILPPGVRAALN